jgi:hypothetical protein
MRLTPYHFPLNGTTSTGGVFTIMRVANMGVEPPFIVELSKEHFIFMYVLEALWYQSDVVSSFEIGWHRRHEEWSVSCGMMGVGCPTPLERDTIHHIQAGKKMNFLFLFNA